MAKRLLRPGELWKPEPWPVAAWNVAPEWAWFWRDVEVVYPFWEGSGGRAANLGRAPGDVTWDTAEGPWQPSPWGQGVYLDNSADESTIFTVDSSDLWHDAFTTATHIVVCTLEEASQGGPYSLIGEGGNVNGVSLMFRTSPKTFHYWVDIANNNAEIDGTSTHDPDPSQLLVVAGRFDNAAMSLWVNGIEEATGTASAASMPSHSTEPGIGGAGADPVGPINAEWGGKILAVYRSSRALSDLQLQRIGHDPWGMFRPAPRRVYRVPDAGGVTGSAAITEPSDTVAGSGGVEVSGSAAITEPSDLVDGDGEVLATITGSATVTEPADEVSASGSVVISGTADITEPVDLVDADGTQTASGTAAITEPTDTVTGSGTVLVSGSAGISEPVDTVSASGTVSGADITGTAAIVEPADTLSGSGAVLISGTAGILEAVDVVSAAGGVLVSGSAAITEPVDLLFGLGSTIESVDHAEGRTYAFLAITGAGRAPLRDRGFATAPLEDSKGDA